MEPEEFYTKDELLDWEYYKEGEITEEKVGRFNFYWRIGGEKSYEFIVGDWACSNADESEPRYSRIAQGWIAFDGVRHIWFRYQKDPEMNGYDNYPNIKSYIKLFEKIEEINESLGIDND